MFCLPMTSIGSLVKRIKDVSSKSQLYCGIIEEIESRELGLLTIKK